MGVVKPRTGCPERLLILRPWRSSKLAWTSPGPTLKLAPLDEVTSRGHCQPRACRNSRQVLTAGDAHKERKKNELGN